MKALTWVRSRPKTLASAAGVAIGAITLTTMAVAYDGLPTTKVDLNDAGVWLTNASSLLVGHFNNESTVIDGGMRTSSDDYDVLQDAQTVAVVDSGNHTLTAVDPARMALTDSAPIPPDAKVALGHLTTAVLNRKSGELWVTSAKGIAGFDMKAVEPVAELGKGADVTVGRDGTVYALSGEQGEVVTIPTDPEGLPLEPSSASVGEIDPSGDPSITAVGTTPVVLDPAAGVVTTPGGIRTEVKVGEDAVLQQASAGADAVVLATSSRLLRVPLDGGDAAATEVDGEGVPAQPVQLRGCTYGAWAVSAQFVRDCSGDSLDVHSDIPGAEESAALTFRVNRDVIVLNDIMSGAAWMANKSLQRVDDWSVLVPPEGETENEEDTTEETVETSLPERTEDNTVPTAEDDEFGVRPGGSTLLPVLDNDNDPDGDVLSATLVGKSPDIGDVQPILNGAALQINVPEGTTGKARFEYEIDDGRDLNLRKIRVAVIMAAIGDLDADRAGVDVRLALPGGDAGMPGAPRLVDELGHGAVLGDDIVAGDLRFRRGEPGDRGLGARHVGVVQEQDVDRLALGARAMVRRGPPDDLLRHAKARWRRMRS